MRIRSLVTFATVAYLLPSVGALAHAEDRWSDPYPGMRHLHRVTANQNIHVLVVDLCTPGVSVRATASNERRQTVSSFGASLGAAAAVNGDFFSYDDYSTNGPSRSAGAPWGGDDHTYVAPLMFGDHRVALPPHEDTSGVPAWAREVVSGHPSIVLGGQYRNNDGDPLCSARHPRTAAGLSADKRTLILAVVDGRATTRIGMTCGELAGLMQEMGAHDVVNLDGGGSSSMWLGNAGIVNRPSDGSARVVGNHLAVHATGTGDAPFCPSAPPRGHLDAAACDRITGWAQDVDVPDQTLPVEVWVGGPPGSDAPHFSATADVHRDDLCAAIGSCKHGFSIRTPPKLRDGGNHEIWIEGIDNWGVTNAVLNEAPATLSCELAAPPFPDGKRRWIVDPDSFAAWRMTSWDIAPTPQQTIDALDAGLDLPRMPELVRIGDRPEVYVVDASADGPLLRHVTSPEVMSAWRFSFDSVRTLSATEAASYAVGAAWPDELFLVREEATGRVYFVDKPDPTTPDPIEPAEVTGGCRTSGTTGDTSLLVGLALLVLVVRRRK